MTYSSFLVILLNIFKIIWWMNIIVGIMDQCDTNIDSSSIYRSMTYILWSSDFALYLEDYLMEKCFTWDNGSVWHKDWPRKRCGSVTYISWSIDFALYHCYRLKLFLYIKTWHRPGVFVHLRALALVLQRCIKWSSSWENLSSGFPTRLDSNQSTQLQRLAKSLEILAIASIGIILFRQRTTKALICAFVVCIWQKQIFSWQWLK